MLARFVEQSDGLAGNFTCTLCMKSYKLKKDVQRHMRFECDLVSQKPNFPCLYCPYVAKRKDKLKQHVSNIHVSSTRYSCPHCKYVAKRKDKLKLHINSRHTAQEQFSCPYCVYVARRKDTLKHHLKRHELARPDFPPSPLALTNGDSKENHETYSHDD
ncbi:unnamed protein product [Bemisia tabaci]|uniref:C2H2-type domain-containing protein n=1 Tax=Bemisia tabaci TaxID=7038 RepID=A0A9N9ZZM8_BEMTA|nr:unnamed protein product [Bemisia tabaci]